MSVPVSFGYIIDIATGVVTDVNMTQLSAGLGTLFIMGGIANGYRIYCFNRAGHSLVRRIRNKLFNNITKQEIAFFDRNSTGYNRILTLIFFLKF